MITYHVVPHTHWDREWYLTYDHFRVLLVHLIDDLLVILEERPDYTCFLLDGQTVVIDDYLEIRPAKRELIEHFVRDERLSVGPWYVLPDTFLVSGEALIRNLQRGRATARTLGRSMDVGYIPDSFGHTAQIPQILRGFGIETAIVWRGFGGEPGQESSEYYWKSPDGSMVLMEHLSDQGYSGAYFDSPDLETAASRFADMRRRIDLRARSSQRLLLSGGDHHWPVPYLPDILKGLNVPFGEDVHLEHSSLAAFMSGLQRELADQPLPEVTGELRFGYRWAFNVNGGVYSSRMHIKQANAAGQRLLERYLEPMNALAVHAGGPSQRALLAQGWTYLLQNHPHDSICGCSIDPVHREMMTRFEKLTNLGQGVEQFSWMHLVPGEEGASGDDRSITFFNPSPYVRDEVVTCDLEFFRQRVVVGLNPDVEIEPPLPEVAGFQLHDTRGREVPFEIVERNEDYGIAYTRYGYPSQSRVERFTIRIPLQQLPPLGFRTLTVIRSDDFRYPETSGSLVSGKDTIENQYLRVEVRPDGAFSITDKTSGIFYGPLGYFEDGGDVGDVYNYSPPDQDVIFRSTSAEAIRIEPIPGDYRIGLRVSGTLMVPESAASGLQQRSKTVVPLPFSTTATLSTFDRHVTFESVVENRSRDHRLRVLFETGRRTNTHHADNAFGVLTRIQEEYDPSQFTIEVPAAVAPMHRFVTVADTTAGATLLADGLPEYELKYFSDGILALTMLRSVGQLGRDHVKMRPGGKAAWHNETPEAQCIGLCHFRYAFLPHASDWMEQIKEINRAAESFLLPVRWKAGKADMTAPADRPYFLLSPSTLVLSAFKEAESGSDTMIRIYNPTGRLVEGELSFAVPPRRIFRTDLEENPVGELTVREGNVRDVWSAYSIHTYRLQTA